MDRNDKEYGTVKDWENAIRKKDMQGKLAVLFGGAALIGGVLLAANLIYGGKADTGDAGQSGPETIETGPSGPNP